MSSQAAALIAAVLGAHLVAIVYLALALARVLERLARLEERVSDLLAHRRD